jgi:hypothetical protein
MPPSAQCPLTAWHCVHCRCGRADAAPLDVLVASQPAQARAAFWRLCDVHPALTFDADGKIDARSHTQRGVAAGGGGGGGGNGGGGNGGGGGDGGGGGGGGGGVSSDDVTKEKTALGIWASNSFALHDSNCFSADDEGGGSVSAAVFRTCSRLNHACVPSCYVAWEPTLRQHTLHALRALKKGDELTIAYLVPDERIEPHHPWSHTSSRSLSWCPSILLQGDVAWERSRDDRRQQLRRKYRFSCACACCSLDGAKRERSEARRARVRTLRAALRECDDDAQLLKLAEALWEATTAEGLPTVWMRHTVIAAMRAAKAAGDADLAIAWAERGATSSRLALGADVTTTRTFEAVVRAWQRARALGDPLPG